MESTATTKDQSRRAVGNRPILQYTLISLMVIAADLLAPNLSTQTSMILLIGCVPLIIYVIGLTIYVASFTNIRNILAATTAIAVVLSVWTNHWPLRMRLNHAEADLARVANRLQHGETIETPFWAGTFHIGKITSSSDQFNFWTVLVSNGHTGLILAKNQDHPKGNIGHQFQIKDDWFVLYED